MRHLLLCDWCIDFWSFVIWPFPRWIMFLFFLHGLKQTLFFFFFVSKLVLQFILKTCVNSWNWQDNGKSVKNDWKRTNPETTGEKRIVNWWSCFLFFFFFFFFFFLQSRSQRAPDFFSNFFFHKHAQLLWRKNCLKWIFPFVGMNCKHYFFLSTFWIVDFSAGTKWDTWLSNLALLSCGNCKGCQLPGEKGKLLVWQTLQWLPGQQSAGRKYRFQHSFRRS